MEPLLPSPESAARAPAVRPDRPTSLSSLSEFDRLGRRGAAEGGREEGRVQINGDGARRETAGTIHATIKRELPNEIDINVPPWGVQTEPFAAL